MRAVRFTARALAIAFYFWKHVALFALGWLALVVTFRGRVRRQALFAAHVVGLFRDLGATFVKVGQIMSTRPDLLPPHVTAALETLQDDVGPFPFADVEETLVRELGRPTAEVFAELSRTPVASASVAQVHKARLTDGRLVAVKVRRPRIDEMCEFDLGVMRGFARALEVIPSLALLAPTESVDEFGHGIRMQLDFRIEAENNRRFRQNFAAERDVLFPALVDELCTSQTLVMEFIDGIKISRFAESRADVADAAARARRKRLAEIGFRVMLKMVFKDGFVHADLHPGNVFVTPDDRLAILDLGLVGELDEAHRSSFTRYFAAWVTGDGKTMATLMTSLSPVPYRGDYAAFEAAVIAFVGRYHGKKLGEVEVATVFFDMMNILRKHRVRVDPSFTLVNIAIAVTEGIGKQLDPEADLMAMALPFFAREDFLRSPATA